MAAATLVDVNAGSDDELQGLLLRVPQLATPTVEQIIKLRPFVSFDDMLSRVNAAFPRTSRLRLSSKMAKHLKVVSVERARDASYGRELVGLCVRIPWSSWDSYADGSGFDTGTVVHYERSQAPPRPLTGRFDLCHRVSFGA